MVRLEPVCMSRRGSGGGAEAGRAAPCACPPPMNCLRQSLVTCAATLALKSCLGALTGGLDAGAQGACGAPPCAGESLGLFSGTPSLARGACSSAIASCAAPARLAPLRDQSAPGSLVAPGLLSSDSALSPGVGRSSAPSCLVPLKLPPLQDWAMPGGLHRPGLRASLQCEPAAAVLKWAPVAAAHGSLGPGSAGSRLPCLSTRGSAPGALGGRQAPLPPVQAYLRPELAQSPTHTCSSAPAGSCGVMLAGRELAWAGGGGSGFPYGMDREAAFAAPMAPSQTPAAALPSSLASLFSVAAAFEMQGAFLGAAAWRCDTPGLGASVAGGGAGSDGEWPTPRLIPGAGPGARAATLGSNASQDTTTLLGSDLHIALATLQARARHACKRLLFWWEHRAFRAQPACTPTAWPARTCAQLKLASGHSALSRRAVQCGAACAAAHQCASTPHLRPHPPGRFDARQRAQAPPNSPSDHFTMNLFPDFDAKDAAAAAQRT